MEIKLELSEELAHKFTSAIGHRKENLLELFQSNIESEYVKFKCDIEEKFVADQIKDEEYKQLLGRPPSIPLKQRKEKIQNNTKKLIERIQKNLYTLGSLDEQQIAKESYKLMTQDTPIEEVYEKYLNETQYEDNEREKIEVAITNEISLAELEKIMPERLKLFRILHSLMQEGIMYSPKKNVFTRIEGH